MAPPETYQVIIVGAGPAGLSAAARAQAHQLRYLLLDKGTLANTIDYYYQRGKYVMALPAIMPLRSDIPFEAGGREAVLQQWRDATTAQQLTCHTAEAVEAVSKQDGVFTVTTTKATYRAENVVLAIGKQGNPRKLGVPGEELPHVSDRLIDPRAYADQHILVVGGGDSAAEVALALAERNHVAISYRSAEFYRMNDSLRGQLLDKIERQELTVYFNSDVARIDPRTVTLTFPDRQARLRADWVFVKIGAEVPRQLLERCGVTFPSADPAAVPEINARYESRVPGLYLIGAIAGQDLIKPALNQGYEVIEYILGHAVEPIDEALLQHTLERLSGASAQDKLTTLAARVPLLADLAAPQLRELALVSTIHSVERGQVVFKEHDFSTTVFTIVEGSIHITSEEYPESTVVRSQGEFFGEMSLLADRPRAATATAAERSLLFEIPRRSLLKLMRAESSVNRRINAAYVVRALQTYLGPTLATEAFRDLAAKAEVVTFAKDDLVFREGDQGDALYVIRSGALKISKTDRTGSEYVIAYRSPGQYVGEMALLSEHNQRQATVAAAMKTEAIRLWRDDFLGFVADYPDIKQHMQREMHRRQVETAVMLEAPHTTAVLTDFITHGVVESTDVLLIDETKCIRCDNCVTACAATHGGQTRLDRQHGPSFASVHVPVSCRHCEGAPCLQDCPPGDAIVRDANGVVRIYEDKCIGCGNCANACPYGVIFMVEAPHQTPWWERFNLWHLVSKPTPAAETHRGIAVKCDLCAGLKGGPACVRSCPTGAAIRVTPEYFKHVDFR